MHLRHEVLGDLLCVDVKRSLAAELLGLDEVELQIRFALGQWRRRHGVVDAVEEVVVVVELSLWPCSSLPNLISPVQPQCREKVLTPFLISSIIVYVLH